jgi:Ni/Co efflux regulator RcnB
MKRLLIPALAAAAMAAAVTPALAQPARAPVNQREAQLQHRIEEGARRGDLTRPEAMRLRAELRRVDRLERYYRRTGHGLSGWERRDLERRLDVLSRQVFRNRHDRQRR